MVRRAERRALAVAADGSHVVPYLNRLSDLLWTLARWQEEQSLPTRRKEPDADHLHPRRRRARADADVLGIPVFAGRRLPEAGADARPRLPGRARLRGQAGRGAAPLPGRGQTSIAVGVGEPTGDRRDAAPGRGRVRAGGVAGRAAATTLLAAAPRRLDQAPAAQAIAEGAALGAYRFTDYKCDAQAVPAGDAGRRRRAARPAKRGVDRGARIAAAVALARDLVNEPAGRR